MLFRLGIITLALCFIGSPLQKAYGNGGQDRTQEIKKLYEIQKNYEKYKVESNWEKIYSYQHPLFRKNVSLEEYKYFDGKITADYRDNTKAHVSGGYSIPSKEFISKNLDKKDILGFPAFRKYPLTSNKFVKIDTISIDKIQISDHGKYFKSVMTYRGIERMEPGLARGDLKFPVSLTMQDYWEKVDGNWYITLLQNTTNISGNIYYHFTPNNKSSWESTKFIEFDSPDLGFGTLVVQAKK